MIALRTFGTDSNFTGTSEFLPIAQPVGVRDGDLLIVGIAMVSAGVTITPPDGWARIATTDPENPLGVVTAAYWKTALNEPERWVFTLSTAVAAIGGVVVYANADGIEPVEASAGQLSGSGTTHDVASVATSVPGEEVLLFLGAGASSSYTSATGFQSVMSKARAATTFAAHRKQLPSAGAIPAFGVTFGTVGTGASLIIVLRPSVGTLSVDDVRRRILDGLPKGADQVYELTTSGDYYKYFQSIASVFKAFAFDLVDFLRSEIIPSKSRYKLPSWERIFGLTTTRTAKAGTLPSRQAQVQSAWRAAAGQGSSIPEVQAVLAPLLGYSDPADVEVIECVRDDLTDAHSYHIASTTALPDGGAEVEFPIAVNDGGVVSSAGARVRLDFDTPTTEDYVVTLLSPGGTQSKEWMGPSIAGATSLTLFGSEFAGVPINGTWLLTVANGDTVDNTLFDGSHIFVEGVAPGQNTAAAIFHWRVYADPAHLGENGTPADFPAARRAIARMAQAHTVSGLTQSTDPYPDTESGEHASIPDECIPV